MTRYSSPSGTPQSQSKKSTRAGGTNRVERVEKEMQTQIAQYLSAAYKGELPGLVTISRVKMPADLRAARVFVSFLMASEEESERGLETLQSWAPDIQSYLNDRVGLRYCPRLTFEIDNTTEKVMKVESMIRNLSAR